MQKTFVILVQQNSHERAGDEAESNTNGENLSNDDNDPKNDVKGKTSKAVVAQGIPGWGKVATLAKTMISLDRLSVSNEEAKNIQVLYGALKDLRRTL